MGKRSIHAMRGQNGTMKLSRNKNRESLRFNEKSRPVGEPSLQEGVVVAVACRPRAPTRRSARNLQHGLEFEGSRLRDRSLEHQFLILTKPSGFGSLQLSTYNGG